MLFRSKTLQTLEEIEANTSEGYWAGADAVDALNNKLMSITDNDAIKSMDVREDGVYMTYVPADGADSVSKKLGSLNFELNTSVDIYFSGADNIRQKINTNIKYTYKNGVLSHVVTSVGGGYGNSECRVSKNITIS